MPCNHTENSWGSDYEIISIQYPLLLFFSFFLNQRCKLFPNCPPPLQLPLWRVSPLNEKTTICVLLLYYCNPRYVWDAHCPHSQPSWLILATSSCSSENTLLAHSESEAPIRLCVPPILWPEIYQTFSTCDLSFTFLKAGFNIWICQLHWTMTIVWWGTRDLIC